MSLPRPWEWARTNQPAARRLTMTLQVSRPNADGRGVKREAGEKPALPPQRLEEVPGRQARG